MSTRARFVGDAEGRIGFDLLPVVPQYISFRQFELHINGSE